MAVASPAGREHSPEYPRAHYAWYVVLVLLVIGITSYLDRNIVSLLVEPIKADLDLTDTEVSVLQGMAYAVFYVAFGLPFGALVDRYNRRRLLAFGIALWSVMTAAGGFADTYWELFAARAGVGIGEACLAPAAFSLIADYFPPSRRGRAMSVYNMANYLGGGASMLIGGLVLKALGGVGTAYLPYIGEIASWKGTFIIIGAPGILLSVLMLTVREPERRQVTLSRTGSAEGFIEHMRHAPRVYATVHIVSAFTAFTGYAVAGWIPTYFVRIFGMQVAEAGMMIGPVAALAGMAGCVSSGILTDLLVARDVRGGRFVLPLAWWPLALAALVVIVFAASRSTALAGVGLFFFGSGLGLASVAPTIHDITPNQFRGRATSLHFVLSGLLGMTAAVTLVALVNDYLFKDPNALGKSMIVVLTPIILGSFVACLSCRNAYEERRQHYLDVNH
ncbi:spinster family MFS transporter [Croceicoccus bisphenolivorans]|uniref:spinster family MFS transporter n=1 Tax=Croceicoccus bisphenolivorans TaxID=1783232 RepID=UPI0009EF3859|nr:MFS transporter [Croceicoccus bisphenolivorans]